MAGSIKWMQYTADSGEIFVVKVDEGNGEALGFDDYAGTGEGNLLPRGFQMRYVNAISAAGVQRRFWVGDPLDPLFAAGGTVTIDSVAYNITSSRGEKRTRPRGNDSGQLDGDAS